MRSFRSIALLAGILSVLGVPSVAEAVTPPGAKRRKHEDDDELRKAPRGPEPFDPPLRQSVQVFDSFYRPARPFNKDRENARRLRQLQRGDVLNWYPGQVRRNWHGA